MLVCSQSSSYIRVGDVYASVEWFILHLVACLDAYLPDEGEVEGEMVDYIWMEVK